MDPSKLVPLLMPADFSDPEVAAVRLIPEGQASPYVALALEHEQFWELAQEPLDFAEYRDKALQNLRTRADRAEWHRATTPGKDGPVDVLVREGDDTTASDLCDLAFLQSILRELDASEVFLAVPTRPVMVASTDAAPVARLCRVRIDEYGHEEFVIGPQLYRFDGDELSVMGLALEQDGRPPDIAPKQRNRASARRVLLAPRRVIAIDDASDAEAENEEGLGYMPLGIWIETALGETAILLALSDPDLASVAKKMDVLLERRLDRYAKRPDFRGEIRFQLNPELIRRSKAHRLELKRILKEKNAELEERGARTVSGDAVFVSGSIGAPRDRSEVVDGPSAEESAQADGERAKVEARRRAEAEAERARRAEEARRVAEANRRAAEEQRLAEERRAIELAPLRRKLALAGALVATLSGVGRVAIAAAAPSGQWPTGAQLVAPVASTVLLVAVLRGVGLGGPVLLGISLVATLQSLARLGARGAPLWIVGVNLGGSLLFGAAAVLLAKGSTLRRLASTADSTGGWPLALGAVLGGLLQLFTGLANFPACKTRFSTGFSMVQDNSRRSRSCGDLSAAICSTVPGCRVTAPTCTSNCSTRSKTACWEKNCAWQDDHCVPRQCHWETRGYGSETTATYQACVPEGACLVRGKTTCIDPCSTPKTREECSAALICNFHECEGTPTRPCEQLSPLECTPELCRASSY